MTMVKIASRSFKGRVHVSAFSIRFRWAFRLFLVAIAFLCCFILSSIVEVDYSPVHFSAPLQEALQSTTATATTSDLGISLKNQQHSSLTKSLADATINHDGAVFNKTASSNVVVTIGFAVAITSCGSDNSAKTAFPIAQAASVLKHSIERASIHGRQGRYDYQLYAIHHPNATECASTLAPLGFQLVARDTPVPVSEIKGDFLREHIVKNGCCGEKELIKFEAFTLTQHPVVVLLDLDALLLKPLDEIFDLILYRKLPPAETLGHYLMWPERELPWDIQVLYTIDYAMLGPKRRIKPFQGGFTVLKPNQTIYDEFVSIIREGDFRNGGGWGGKTGKFWGGQTFQGLMPYYFQVLHPGRAVELNWCTFNNMASPSRDGGVVDDKPHGTCFTNQETCEDCRSRPIDQVVSTHFTVCQKPWNCMRLQKDILQMRLCRQFHHAWFQARSELEQSWGRSGWGEYSVEREHFFGFCKKNGLQGFTLIVQPNSTNVAN